MEPASGVQTLAEAAEMPKRGCRTARKRQWWVSRSSMAVVILASPTLAETLGGKRSRAALPDDFTELVKPLQRRTVERHNKATDEGRSLRALREIRVIAKPAWQADSIEVGVVPSSDYDPDVDDCRSRPSRPLMVRYLGQFIFRALATTFCLLPDIIYN